MIKGLTQVCLLIALTSCVVAQDSSSRVTPARNAVHKTREGSRSPFRYLIVSGVSETEKYANRGPHYYVMDVLMEDSAFNESNLKILFGLLNKRFNERPGLFVNVYTSLDAIRTPEEYDETDLFGPIEDYHRVKFAFYSRSEGGERFQYGIPNVVKPTVVVIKSALPSR